MLFVSSSSFGAGWQCVMQLQGISLGYFMGYQGLCGFGRWTLKKNLHHDFQVKIYPLQGLFNTLTPSIKKGPKQTGRGQPPPPNGQCPFKSIFFFVDVVPNHVAWGRNPPMRVKCSQFQGKFDIFSSDLRTNFIANDVYALFNNS